MSNLTKQEGTRPEVPRHPTKLSSHTSPAHTFPTEANHELGAENVVGKERLKSERCVLAISWTETGFPYRKAVTLGPLRDRALATYLLAKGQEAPSPVGRGKTTAQDAHKLKEEQEKQK